MVDLCIFSNRYLSDSEEQKTKWREEPGEYREYRKMIERELNRRFKFVLKNSQESDDANNVSLVDPIAATGAD